MYDTLIHVLTLLYGGVAVLTIMGYWPTIRDLYHHKKPSANITTYLMWTIACAIGVLYTTIILDDALVQLVAAINFVANLVILVLSVRLCKK